VADADRSRVGAAGESTGQRQMIVFDTANMAERYNKRLAIVVPYRDRAEHLRKFVPHLATYFQSDKLDRHIPISLHVVEQSGNAPFNRGRVLNCGYALACDNADYICFHDVDYLPLWADYSWSARPARLAWNGLQLPENPNTFFGGVVLFDKAAFENVNGYPNEYWGWGCEDLELGCRCSLAGLGFDKRDGTYLPLPHPHAGYTAAGTRTEEAQQTRARFQKRRGRLADFMTTDGLSNLKFELLDKRPISIDGKILPDSFHYVVDIGRPETAELDPSSADRLDPVGHASSRSSAIF
jgi:N-terminal region of glycosyl transferase group 7/N-terminal domain of galactosyltransferase